MLQDENGRRLAVANSQWILVDMESGRVVQNRTGDCVALSYGRESRHVVCTA
ncbi:MAG: hypothetical protein ACLR1V_00740 [Coprococcus sp.]